MADQSPDQDELQRLMHNVDGLRQRIHALRNRTQNEDVEHADIGLQIVHHALDKVAEHTCPRRAH